MWDVWAAGHYNLCIYICSCITVPHLLFLFLSVYCVIFQRRILNQFLECNLVLCSERHIHITQLQRMLVQLSLLPEND